jgi:NAD(P)-dependent dehydrogenase (short-subunit alcohol dehydrogenase family)
MKNIVITGCSSGIGYELVKSFSEEAGYRIIAISRNEQKLARLAQETESQPSKVYIVSFDLVGGDYNSLGQSINQFIGNDGIDLIISNAGALINKPFKEPNDADYSLMFDTNVKAVFKMIQSLSSLLNTGSHVVNISSMGGYQGSAKFTGLSLYSASKGALAVLTECMAEEFKEEKISFNCLALGAVQTEMLATAFPGYKAPLEADEMASYIKDFGLTAHRYMNGKIIPLSLSTP